MVQPPVIKTTSLSYRYPDGSKALSGINLQIERGSVYGFLGPNGSGKTTTISLLLGLLDIQDGSIEIFGQQLQSNRINILKKIGSLIETPSLYGHLTARENLEVYRSVYGAPKERIEEVLKTVGLEGTGKKLTKRFSLGMKQRLSIALALLPKPELLILDEPSNGLDPAGIIELRELIKNLNQAHDTTIMISSHLLSEIEKMVTHVGIIDKGKLLFQGTLSQLHQFQQAGARLLINTSNNAGAISLLEQYEPVQEGEGFSILFHDQQQVALVQRVLVQNNLDIYLLQPRKNDLEQLFIDLTSSPS